MSKKQVILEPLISVAGIAFGDKIENYADRKFEYTEDLGEDSFDSYTFEDVPVSAIVSNGLIESIGCAEECIWNGTDLIGLSYEDFKKLYPNEPDKSEFNFLLLEDEDGEEELQDIHEYYDLGISLWVFEGKIVTVYADADEADEE